jgi:glycosyltransferase involved in cell wall biosynthesis
MTGLALEDLANMQRKTVVLVCMVDSIHVARWIAQFDPTEVKFILFPSGPNRRVHPKILEMIENGKSFDNQITIVPLGGKLSLILWALDRFFSDRIRGLLLRRILSDTPPDFVHALEFQHAGYVTMRALADKSITTPFIATNYGSDIYWFQKFPTHKTKIRRILDRADLYSAECQRDYLLAKQLGFEGIELPLGPNSGGVELVEAHSELQAPSKRKTIAIKGYHGWVGRALLALDAVESLHNELRNYEIVVYSANSIVARRARLLQRRTGLTFAVHKKSELTHSQVQEIFQRSRLYVGISLSDGISTSLLEAMSAGCFPIQTSTSCADEWISSGKSGVLIRNLNAQEVSSALRLALVDDVLVDQAVAINREAIKVKGDSKVLRQTASSFYGIT